MRNKGGREKNVGLLAFFSGFVSGNSSIFLGSRTVERGSSCGRDAGKREGEERVRERGERRNGERSRLFLGIFAGFLFSEFWENGVGEGKKERGTGSGLDRGTGLGRVKVKIKERGLGWSECLGLGRSETLGLS